METVPAFLEAEQLGGIDHSQASVGIMVGDAVVIADIDVRVASIASFAPDPLVGEVAVDELPPTGRCEVVHIGEVVMDHALDVGEAAPRLAIVVGLVGRQRFARHVDRDVKHVGAEDISV